LSLPRILCVDDEPHVVEGIKRLFRKRYDVSTDTAPQAVLDRISAGETFDVIVSDMRMPGMNGAALLSLVRQRAPDTVRLLLTGHSDIDSAIAAVNDGHIFRFLTKPCPFETLSAALDAAIAQHRLVTAEKVLLEQTLVGSIRAMTEVLALVHPEGFGRAIRQGERARSIAERLEVRDAWHVEVASMLSAVGYVVLPGDVAAKLNAGLSLEAAERDMVSRVPAVIERVISHIPRLDLVREVLSHQGLANASPAIKGARSQPTGARILKIVHDLSRAEATEGSTEAALAFLRAHRDDYDKALFEAMTSACSPRPPEVKPLELRDVQTGMVLASDVKSRTGMLLVTQGQRVTQQLLERLRNFDARVGVIGPLLCEVANGHASARPPS
jgi:FixJ family two-component response regulator